MKQENSLDSNLSELISIEKEQMRILSEMNMRDSSAETQKLMNSAYENTRVINNANSEQVVQNGAIPNMYMYASENGPSQQRVNYNPPEMPATTYEQISKNSKEQFSNYANSLKETSSNYGIISSIIPQNSRVSNETRTNTALDAGYRIGQAGAAGIGAIGTAGSTWALGAALGGAGVGGFLGSMALTGGASALIGVATDMSIDEIKQQSAYRKYLTQNSYMFINPQESNNDRDIAGFSQKEAKSAAKFLRGLSSETYLKDEEIMTLTQKFTEGGMLKDVKDLESFKKQMRALTKSVKTGALILNESYENITEVLKEFKKLGLDQKNFNEIMSGIKVNASNLGVDASELTQNTINYLNNLNYGTGNSNNTAYSRLEDTTLYTSEMYNKLQDIPEYRRTQQEKSAYNMIKNLGGVNEAAQYLNTMQEKIVDNDYIKNQIAAYFFDYDTQKKNWTLNQGKFEDFLSSDKTYGQISQEVAIKLGNLSEQGYGAAVNEFTTNAGTYIRNSMTNGDMTKLIQGTINSFLRDGEYGGNGYDTSKILSDIFQVKDTGAQSLLSNYLDFRVGSGDGLGYTFNQQKKWTEVVNETKAQTPSIGEWVASQWDDLKKDVAAIPVGISDWFGDISLGISDWWYRTRNGVSAPKLSDTFSINSLKYGSSTEGIHQEQKEAIGTISSVKDSLTRLSEKGYSIDDDIQNLVKNATDTFNRAITTTRERIANWGQVDEKVAERKDEIVNLSATTGLSEVILSALVKYDQNNQTDRVKGSDLKVLAESLKDAVNKYQGNETLGLLQSYTGINVDDVLKKQFNIDVNGPLSKEDIEKLQNIKIDDIELSDETKKIIKDLLNVDLSKGGKDSNGNVTNNTASGSYAVDYTATGTTQKNEELIKLASQKFGFSEAVFSALLSTENESGENQSVNSAGARGAAQLTSSVTGWAGQVQDLVTGETWDGDMAKVTGAENNSMNISVGAAHFGKYLDYAKGNAYIAYGMYNGGPTGFGNILRSAGYDEDQWGGLTGAQIQDILKTYTPGTEYEKAMDRFVSMLEKVTGDSNIKNISGTEINSGGGSTGEVKKDESGNEYTINNGVRTYTETTYYDTTKSKEENEKMQELQTGIVTSQTGQSRFDFVKEVRNVINAKDTDYESLINSLVESDSKSKKYANYMKEMVNKGYSYEQIVNTDEYEELKTKALEKGGENIGSVLEQISSAVKTWTTFGGSGYSEDKKYDSDELKNSAKERYENADLYKNKYVLEKYGASVGIELSDFDGDLAKYNAAINETAKTFVQGNTKQVTEYLQWKQGGSEKTESAQMFEDLSATDKLALISSTELVNNALGKDVTGYGSISEHLTSYITDEDKTEFETRKQKLIDEKQKRIDEINKELNSSTSGSDRGGVYSSKNQDKVSELLQERARLSDEISGGSQYGLSIDKQVESDILGEKLLSDKDKELMKYLHKDSSGKVYYDATVESEEQMTISDLADWQEQGEKKVNYGRAKTLLESENGIVLGNLSFDDAIVKAKEMYDKTKLEFDKNSLDASTALTKVNDVNLQAELSKYYQNNDLAGLKDFLATAKDGKITKEDGTVLDVSGNKDAIDQLSQALSKLQDSADISEIMNLITGLQQLKDSLQDTATAARMTYDSLDEGSKYGADTGISQDVKNLFQELAENESRKTDGDKNETFQKVLDAMSGMTPENIKEAILQGLESGDGIKIKDTMFALDQDTMMKLGDIVSTNMDEAIKKSLTNDTSYGDGEGSIDNLTSGREKEIAAAMNISVDELKDELAKLAELNSDLATRQDTQTEEYKKLEKDRNDTVEEIFEGYSKSMKDYKDTAESATETFSSTMQKYDDEVAKAIGILEDRINNKGFIKQGLSELLSSGWNALTSWGKDESSSSGGTVR